MPVRTRHDPQGMLLPGPDAAHLTERGIAEISPPRSRDGISDLFKPLDAGGYPCLPKDIVRADAGFSHSIAVDAAVLNQHEWHAAHFMMHAETP